MSVSVIEAILARAGRMRPRDRVVLIALAERADPEGRCWPSVADIARRAGIGERATQYALRALVAAGLLDAHVRGGRSRTNRYRIRLEALSPSPDGRAARPDAPEKRCTPVHHNAEKRCTDEPEKVHARAPEPSRRTLEVVGDAHAREPDALDAPAPAEARTWRERLLEAMGHPAPGITASGRILAGPVEMHEAQRWERDLGLSRTEILEVISAVCAGKRDGPPRSLRYFTDPMRRLAAEKARPPLQSINHGGQSHEPDQYAGPSRIVSFPRPAPSGGDPFVAACAAYAGRAGAWH